MITFSASIMGLIVMMFASFRNSLVWRTMRGCHPWLVLDLKQSGFAGIWM